MFPIPWNKEYRKKDGTLIKINDAMGGGGGSDLPPHTSSDAGKVLTVGDDGDLEWHDGGENSEYGAYTNAIIGYGLFKPNSNSYNVGVFHGGPSSIGNRVFDTDLYTLDEAFRPDIFTILEFYNYITETVITDLGLEVLYDGIESSVDSAELAHPVTDYDILVLQGCYSVAQTSEYNTSMFYVNPDIANTYWYGVKDRNNSYSGILSFTDSTHVSLSASRRIRIYGIKL